MRNLMNDIIGFAEDAICCICHSFQWVIIEMPASIVREAAFEIQGCFGVMKLPGRDRRWRFRISDIVRPGCSTDNICHFRDLRCIKEDGHDRIACSLMEARKSNISNYLMAFMAPSERRSPRKDGN